MESENQLDDSVWAQPLGTSAAIAQQVQASLKRRHCSIMDCYNNSVNQPVIGYFKIPSDQQRAVVWLKKIGQLKNNPKNILVCEKHFEPHYVIKEGRRRRLTTCAVPTLHLPAPEALTCTPDVAATTSGQHTTPIAIPIRVPPAYKPRVSGSTAVRNINNFMNKYKKFPRVGYRHIAEIITLQKRFSSRRDGWKFTNEFKFFALKLYISSPNTYKTMQSLLSLPTISTLYRLYIPSSTYVCENLIIALKIKVDTMTAEQKECAVCIGTMDAKAKLHYNIKKDELLGLHDVDGSQTLEPATTALIVMVRGIYDNWKQAISCLFLAQHQGYEDVRACIIKIISKMIEIGLTVRVLISDMETDFIGLSKEIGNNCNQFNFHVNNQRIYYMYDPAHLMKNLKDSFALNNFVFNGKTARWEHITACSDYECQKPLRLAPQLTSYHIIHTHAQSERDKVQLAAEVFSQRTAAAVSAYEQLRSSGARVSDEPSDGTVQWILLMNKLFQLLNFASYKFNDETTNLFSGTDAQHDFINEMLNILRDLRLVDAHRGSDKTANAKVVSRLRGTLKVILSLFIDLNPEYRKFPTFLSRDCLDSFFDKVRKQHGRLPTCRQILLSINKTPIFNIFQNHKSKRTDSLDFFLNNAIVFSQIVMVYEQAQLNGNCCESTVGIDLDAVELSEKNPLQHLAAYLLYEGYKRHSDCEATKSYVFENANSITVILSNTSNNNDACLTTVMVMVPTEFVEFIESMELTMKLYFETEYQRKALTGLREHLFAENVTFAMPCKCFPLDYVKSLFMEYRFNLILKYNNAEYEAQTEDTRKYFIVNQLA